MEKEKTTPTEQEEKEEQPKKKSKLKTVIVILVLLAIAVGLYALFHVESSLGVSYSEKPDGTYEVSAIKKPFKAIVIPATHNGKPVTGISAKAALGYGLASITIPDSVTTIGEHAFEGNDFSELVIPDSVTSIGYYAFAGCNHLTTVEIGKGLKTIEYNAFAGCDILTSVVFADDCALETIGSEAFIKCPKLAAIKLPNGVTDIGDCAFFECESLQYNEYDNGLYLGSAQNPNLYFAKVKDTDVKTLNILDGTIIIGDGTYGNGLDLCSELRTIKLPESVKIVNGITNGESLAEIRIPAGVTRLGLTLDYLAEQKTSIDIYYDGTKEQWAKLSSIGKSTKEWFITIHCKDGNIRMSE